MTFFKSISDFLQLPGENEDSNEDVLVASYREENCVEGNEKEPIPSIAATWLYLLRRLLFMTVDIRTEVRHSEFRDSLILPVSPR